MKHSSCILYLLVSILPLPSFAQGVPKQEMVPYFTGTGFYVSRDGYLITNNHVVQDCVTLSVAGAVPESPAKIVARDAQNDLVLLRTEVKPPDVAKLRSEYFPPATGEEVVAVGYPGNNGLSTRESRITDVKGPKGEEKWLQFSNTTDHGNSGSALLDQSGNVIGVVMGKSESYQVNKQTKERTLLNSSDIAISPNTLKAFLEAQGVTYRDAISGSIMSSRSLENRAKEFTVQVRCEQKKKEEATAQ